MRHTVSQPKPDLIAQKWLPNEDESMAVDYTGAGGTDSGNSRAAPIYEDGKYGFGKQSNGRGHDDGRYSDGSRDQGGLVSDGMMHNYYSEDRKQYGRR